MLAQTLDLAVVSEIGVNFSKDEYTRFAKPGRRIGASMALCGPLTTLRGAGHPHLVPRLKAERSARTVNLAAPETSSGHC